MLNPVRYFPREKFYQESADSPEASQHGPRAVDSYCLVGEKVLIFVGFILSCSE